MTDNLEKRARLAEIDKLLPLNRRECDRLNDQIERLTEQRDNLLKERDAMREEQITLTREMAQ